MPGGASARGAYRFSGTLPPNRGKAGRFGGPIGPRQGGAKSDWAEPEPGRGADRGFRLGIRSDHDGRGVALIDLAR